MVERKRLPPPGAAILVVLAFAALGAVPGLTESGRSQERAAGTLPWSYVATQFSAGAHFFSPGDVSSADAEPAETHGRSKCDSPADHALTVGQAAPIRLGPVDPLPDSAASGTIQISQWVGEKWQLVRQVKPRIENQRVWFTASFDAEGLYAVQYLDAAGSRDPDRSVHVIVSRNWKRDLLAFCRAMRERAEMNPDPELIRSSVAAAHWDYALQSVTAQPILSDTALRVLSRALESTRAFEAGDCPDLVQGANKLRLKRFPGGPVHEFIVAVPEAYDGSKPWPVFLRTDDMRWGAAEKYNRRSGWIDIWWHTAGEKDVDWKSFQALMSLLGRKLRLDMDRVYVNGDCQNGLAAMTLALKHPDYWAECSASLTSSCREMAGNALNLATVFVKGGHQEDSAAGYYNFGLKCFQYFGCEHLIHSMGQTVEVARGTPAPTATRVRRPSRVFWSVDSLDSPRAYWVQIDGREDENFIARLDARVTGHVIEVLTENVGAYSLYLEEAPLEPNVPIEIVHNGREMGAVRGPVFSWVSDKYKNGGVTKDEHLCGPVADAFRDPFFVVWGGSGKSADEKQMNREIATEMAADAPCFRDDAVPDGLVGSHHMILVGSLESNQWLRRVHAALPLSLGDNEIVAAGRRYSGQDLGVILLYPNPLNPRRYVVVFSGLSVKALRSLPKAYSELQALRPADVGVFEVTEEGAVRWHVFEKFNPCWGWHEDWNEIAAVAKKTHPAWQWRRWLTQVVREQLGADVAICEDPLLFGRVPGDGQLTFRELANTFVNQWIVKVELDGRKLRQLLMTPMAEASGAPAGSITIEGVTLFGSGADAGRASLSLDAIVDTKIYTLACNHKYLNGKRVGSLFQDYRIAGQTHLLPLLKKHLESAGAVEIDSQLDRLTVQLF
jgi:hypothetical protein